MTSIAIDRLDGLSSSTAVKGPARCATTANISLTGLQTVDGVALAADDRVLVKDQDSASENGIWKVSTGAWSRTKDFYGNRDVRKGSRVLVTDGTVGAGNEFFVSTANPIVIGTTNITFTETAASIAGGDAVLNADTSTADMAFVVDEDNMASDSATKVPSQQSVKAYVDANGLNPYHFGAVGDGSADDTAAINAWVAAANGWLILPPGRFKTSDPIVINLDTVDAVTIQGAGESLSELQYTGTGDFITLARDDQVGALSLLAGVTVDGLTFRTTQAGLANALVIDLDDAAPSTGSYEGFHRRVGNVRFMGEGSGTYWAEGLRWNNATFSTSENVMFRGLNNAGNAVVYGGTRDAVDNFIGNIKAIGCDTIVLVENDNLEGLYIGSIVGVSVLHAVDWQAASPNPALVVDSGHVAVVDGGTAFLLSKVSAPTLSNLSIYLAGTSTAISLDNEIAHAMVPSFANVNVFGTGGSVGRTGLAIGAGVNRAALGGITFNDIATGISLAAGCTNITLLPSLGFFNVTTPISDGTSGAQANAIRKWSTDAARQRLSFSNDAGILLEMENQSRAASTAKFVQYTMVGRDTVGTEKQAGYLRVAPTANGNWINSELDIALRGSDAVASVLNIKGDGFMTVKSLSRGAPVTKTADFTVAATENFIRNNKGSACAATLPAAATFSGRELYLVNIGGAFALTSATANVEPRAGGAASTAILPATDGAWALLVSDGTNWVIVASS